MGRGRAKAKQQKVARDLKYSTQDTDFTALQRELSSEERASYDSANGSGGNRYSDDDFDEERWVSGSR